MEAGAADGDNDNISGYRPISSGTTLPRPTLEVRERVCVLVGDEKTRRRETVLDQAVGGSSGGGHQRPIERRKLSLKKSCDFCVKRKRHCDGLGLRRCSFCIAKNQKECHYRCRLPSTKPSFRRKGVDASEADAAADASSPQLPATGRSFWQTNEEIAVKRERQQSATAAAAGAAASWAAAGPLLPLKRGRFSASPATGLVGLQENGFLGDFFGCMGFLSLASESTIRGAMVGIMLAGATGPQQQWYQQQRYQQQRYQHQHQPEPRAPSRAYGKGKGHCGWHLAEGGPPRSSYSSGSEYRSWEEAVQAQHRALPRNAATCMLWCAIALGALVRGCPSAMVERYANLAQESLVACSHGTSADTARAYIAMAILYNFLGSPMNNHECLKLATDIVNRMPPEQLPTGIHQILRYAGKAWVFESELASDDEIRSYWENAVPIWQLSDNVMEQDICSLVLSVDIRVDQTILEAKGGARVFLVDEQQPAMTSVPPRLNPSAGETAGRGRAGAGGGAGDRRLRQGCGLPNPEEEAERAPLSTLHPITGLHKDAMPEMLRLGECLESSKMHQGLGGLIYFMRLGYLQFVNNQIPASVTSFQRALNTILRYPGVCRYSCWSHFAHSQLWCLAFGPGSARYEQLRAVYNPVRPAGCPPAPPHKEWRGMSDICDHPYCRRVSTQCVHVVDHLD